MSAGEVGPQPNMLRDCYGAGAPSSIGGRSTNWACFSPREGLSDSIYRPLRSLFMTDHSSG